MITSDQVCFTFDCNTILVIGSEVGGSQLDMSINNELLYLEAKNSLSTLERPGGGTMTGANGLINELQNMAQENDEEFQFEP